MALIDLNIPAGVYRNGTDLQSQGRWRDANLVRWHDGVMRPIGGWRTRSDNAGAYKLRGMITWSDNSADRWIATGSYNKLYAYSASGTQYDLTPAGFTEGREDALSFTGFGGGAFGAYAWGVARPDTANILPATCWHLDTWGEYLVAMTANDGKVYEWDLDIVTGSETVTNGTFDTDSDWTKGADWAIASGVASWTGTTSNALSQTITVVDDKTYEVSIDVIDATDTAEAKITITGDTSTTVLLNQVLAVGTNTVRFLSDDTSVTVEIEPNSGTEPNFDIDNVSIKKVPAAKVISNAPTNNESIIVTEERFLFCLGAGGNPRKVQWSDREDNTSWTPAVTNEAGDLELNTSGALMKGMRVRGQTLLLTSRDAHVANYIGPPYVYGFERVGTSCGLAACQAAIVVDAGAFWMGVNSFYTYNGSAVSELPCDVSDYVFNDINKAQISKAFCMSNAMFGEIWWFYPSAAGTENNRYVVFNYVEGTWYIGELDRTAGADRGAFRQPMMAKASDKKIYEHEVGLEYDSLTPFAESGPFRIGTGDQVMAVTEMLPDEKTQGDVNATFKTRFYPNDTERSYGPYTMSNPTSVRFTGRQVRMRVEGVNYSDWRVGINRLDVIAGGRR
jgi:hypothetical protein